MNRYVILIEPTDSGFSAYLPDEFFLNWEERRSTG